MNRNQRQMALRQASLLLVAGAALTLTTGCGKSGPTLVPVKGTVTIDGKPAKEGGVTFYNAANQMSQFVTSIRPDGTYVMMHNRDEGAPAGEYVVTVLVSETPMTPDGNYSGLPKTVSHRKFSNPGTTPLKVTVAEGAAADAYDLKVTK